MVAEIVVVRALFRFSEEPNVALKLSGQSRVYLATNALMVNFACRICEL
jgi:hypothetical protein